MASSSSLTSKPKTAEKKKAAPPPPKETQKPQPPRLADLASTDGEIHIVYRLKRNVPLGERALSDAWELSERRVVLPPRPPPVQEDAAKKRRRRRRRKRLFFFSPSSSPSDNGDGSGLEEGGEDYSRLDAVISHAAVAGAWLLAQAAWRARRALGDAADAAADGGVAAVAGQLRKRLLDPCGNAAKGIARRLGWNREEKAVAASVAAAVEKTEEAAAESRKQQLP